jgi:hypothetical protein
MVKAVLNGMVAEAQNIKSFQSRLARRKKTNVNEKPRRNEVVKEVEASQRK